MNTNELISNIATIISVNRFADMCNKDNRGENFSWENFPKNMSDSILTELKIYHKKDKTPGENDLYIGLGHTGYRLRVNLNFD